MVLALFSIYSNVSDVGKLSVLLALHMFYRKGKFTNLTKGSVVSTIELLHPTDKMLKKGL